MYSEMLMASNVVSYSNNFICIDNISGCNHINLFILHCRYDLILTQLSVENYDWTSISLPGKAPGINNFYLVLCKRHKYEERGINQEILEDMEDMEYI